MQHICSHAGVLLNEKFKITPTHKIATFLVKTLEMLAPDERLAVQIEAWRVTAALIPTLQAQYELTSQEGKLQPVIFQPEIFYYFIL